MARLIDADALFPYGSIHFVENDGFATADKIYGIIKSAPTVEAEPVRHVEWIKASDRLPPYGQEVLVCDIRVRHCYFGVWILKENFDGLVYWEDDHGWEWDVEEITHWMPLPESPKEEA